jgi:predicted O-linked N-acetylglucosamine transferase (SPINDLY family)
VTCPGEFMRGRHSYGILKMLEIEETIAYSETDYIKIAIKLGCNSKWRKKIRDQVRANKHKIYNDQSCVLSLEKFYCHVSKNK